MADIISNVTREGKARERNQKMDGWLVGQAVRLNKAVKVGFLQKAIL